MRGEVECGVPAAGYREQVAVEMRAVRASAQHHTAEALAARRLADSAVLEDRYVMRLGQSAKRRRQSGTRVDECRHVHAASRKVGNR